MRLQMSGLIGPVSGPVPLQNGTFIDDITPWTPAVFPASPPATIAWDVFDDGSMFVNFTGFMGGAMSEPLPVDPGDFLYLLVSRYSAGSTSTFVVVNFYESTNGSGEYTEEGPYDGATTNSSNIAGFRSVFGTFQAGPTHRSYRIVIGAAVVSSTLFFTDVQGTRNP